MSADHYARSGRRWALGAELVYRPIAAEPRNAVRLCRFWPVTCAAVQ
jgi:hypothetical protein